MIHRATSRSLTIFSLLLSVIADAAGASPPTCPDGPELRELLSLVLAHRQADAEPRLAAAAPACEAAGEPIRTGMVQLVSALSKVTLSEHRAALADFEAARASMVRADDAVGEFLILWMLGATEQVDGRSEDAERHLEEAIRLSDQFTKASDRFKLDAFLLFGATLGAPVGSLEPMKDLGPLLAPMLGQFLGAIARIQRASVLIDLRRFDAAEAELTAVRRLAQLIPGLLDGEIEEQLGHLRRRQGRWQEARDHYLRALEGTRLLPRLPFEKDDRVAIGIRGYLAEVELLAGRPEEALRWNAEALAQAQKDGAKWLEARVLEKRAELLADQGRHAEAIEVLTAAEELAKGLLRPRLSASIAADLGTYHLHQGNYGAAAAHLERALETYEKLGEDYTAAPIATLLGEAYLAVEAHPAATQKVLRRAQELAQRSQFGAMMAMNQALASWQGVVRGETSMTEFKKTLGEMYRDPAFRSIEGFSETFAALSEALLGAPVESPAPAAFPIVSATIHVQLGLVAHQAGRLDEAIAHWQRAVTEAERAKNKDFQALTHGALGAALHLAKRDSEALRHFERAASLLDEAGQGIQVDDLMAAYLGTGRQVMFAALVRLLGDSGRSREAFELAERAKARALLQLLGNVRVDPPASESDDELAFEADRKRRTLALLHRELAAGVSLDRVREIDDESGHLRRELEGLFVRLKAKNSEYARLVTVDPAPLATVQASLEGNTTLISYFQTGTSWFAWVVERERIEMVRLPVPADTLEIANRFFQAVSRGSGVPQASVPGREEAKRLYQAFIEPLRPHIHGSKLLLVPHGPLHYLPFAALLDPKTERYLIADYTLVHLPSASVLEHLRTKESALTGTALVLGAPPAQGPGLSALPGAAAEVEAVGQLLKTNPWLGQEATESKLRALSGTADVVHVAAHGILDSRAPRFSRLVLAPDDQQDGNLEVHELFGGIDWSGVNLVVLAACDTARGERTGGDEIVGLTRALFYAGSPGVISTLWAIHDEASKGVMIAFYRRFVGGEGIAEALRGAQLEALANPETADPFSWAAFTLHGDPQGRWPAPPVAAP